jgi:hypothetical protein
MTVMIEIEVVMTDTMTITEVAMIDMIMMIAMIEEINITETTGQGIFPLIFLHTSENGIVMN